MTKAGSGERPMVLDLVSGELKREIIKRKNPPYSLSTEKISKWLLEEHQVKVSHVSISKWLKRREATVTASIYGSKDFTSSVEMEYGILLSEYFNSVKQVISLMKEVCSTRQIDVIAKTECAVKLMKTISDCTVIAKDIVVGDTSASEQMLDIEGDIESAMKDVPMIRVISENISK